MAASSNIAIPFTVYRVHAVGSANAEVRRPLEKSAQTFLQGTPVQIDAATGFLQACPAITNAATAIIAGMSEEYGSNLTTSGTAKAITSYAAGSVPNQPNAVVIANAGPPNDGTCGVCMAQDINEFQGVFGHGTTDANATIAQADLGAIYGLTKDLGNNFWYIDKNKTTVATGACVVITLLIDAVATLHGKVGFKVLRAAQQLF
jgi:hypothetical protein